MNPVYIDVATELQAAGLGNLGSDLFGGEWGLADKQILVLSGGSPPSDLKEVYESVEIQILVRGDKRDSDSVVYNRAYEVSRYLLRLSDQAVLNGCIYKGFEAVTNIAPLGKDDNQRFIYSMNFNSFRSGVA
jgi:hypothetical protein